MSLQSPWILRRAYYFYYCFPVKTVKILKTKTAMALPAHSCFPKIYRIRVKFLTDCSELTD